MTSLLSSPYDHIFIDMEKSSNIPAQFYRVLAFSESGYNAALVNPTSNATGLFQIVPVVANDYAKAHRVTVSQSDLLNPEINSKIAESLVVRIVNKYKSVGLPPDWLSHDYIGLVIAGYNAGYVGVALLLSRLASPTITAINEKAKELAASGHKWARFLGADNRLRYWLTVTQRYFASANAGFAVDNSGFSWVFLIAAGFGVWWLREGLKNV